MNIAELAIRGSSVLFDIQMAAIRSIWHAQARSAAALGAPDCSELVHFADTGTKRLISSAAEQMLSSARQATDTITEMQAQFGRIVEQGTMQLTEEIRHGIEELTQRTQEGLQAVKEIAQQGADESERMMQQGSRQSGGQQSDRGSEDDDEQRFGARQSQQSSARQDKTASEDDTGAQNRSGNGRQGRTAKRGSRKAAGQKRANASSGNRAGRRR